MSPQRSAVFPQVPSMAKIRDRQDGGRLPPRWHSRKAARGVRGAGLADADCQARSQTSTPADTDRSVAGDGRGAFVDARVRAHCLRSVRHCVRPK